MTDDTGSHYPPEGWEEVPGGGLRPVTRPSEEGQPAKVLQLITGGIASDDTIPPDEDIDRRDVLDRDQIEKRFLEAGDVDEVFAVIAEVQPPTDPRDREHLRAKVIGHLKALEIRAKAIDGWLASAPTSAEDGVDVPYVDEAPPLAMRSDILLEFGATIARGGLVGEQKYAKILYLASISRLLPRPVSVVGKGPSASGKSETGKRVLEFVPPEGFVDFTSVSDHYLIYSQRSFKHVIVVIYEAASTEENSFLEYIIRSLLSEGCIKHSTVVKDPATGEMVGKDIVKEGPTGLFTTTTQLALHPENETRLLSVTSDDSPVQTRNIMRAIAGEGDVEAPDVAEWHELQRWIAQHQGIDVIVPFAHQLAELMPDNVVRLRRDFGQLMSLVCSHALLHLETRERDDRGRLVATEADYEAVRSLVGDVIGDTLGTNVSPQTRETVEAVALLQETHITGVKGKQVAELLGMDESVVNRRLKAAAKRGYIRDHHEKPYTPNQWKIEDPLPEDQILLPPLQADCTEPTGGLHAETPSDLQDCTLASESRGQGTIRTHPDDSASPPRPPQNGRKPANVQVDGAMAVQASPSTVDKPDANLESTAADTIREARNNGHSDKAIAASLNVGKVPPPDGAPAWSAFTVGQVAPPPGDVS